MNRDTVNYLYSSDCDSDLEDYSCSEVSKIDQMLDFLKVICTTVDDLSNRMDEIDNKMKTTDERISIMENVINGQKEN